MPACNALSNHMCITVARSWRPCCRYAGFPHVDVEETSFHDYTQSDFYMKVVDNMTGGWDPGCRKCQQEEKRGHNSLRQQMNRDLDGSTDVQSLEISLSNECNLACRMCSPTYSTTWNRLVKDNPELREYHHAVEQPEISVEKIFKGINLRELKKIKYLGGEPFITPQTRDLMEYLADNNIIQHVEFECNTNATLFPEKWLKYLDRFRAVNIELSIDGVGAVNDYIRHGKTWKQIEPNIFRWQEYASNSNTRVHMFSTVQAYNLHDMKNVKNLCLSLDMNHYSSLLSTPDFLSADVLPAEYLDRIKDSYNQKYYESISNNGQFDKFCEYTYNTDKVFGLHINDVVPELYKYMEKKL